MTKAAVEKISPHAPRCTRGGLAKYASHVTSASEGAVTDKDLKL
jgi:dihydroxyacid dehydratase/phosphogluconate dehydratase